MTSNAWNSAGDVTRRIALKLGDSTPALLKTMRLVPLRSGGLHIIFAHGSWEMTIEIPADESDDQDFLGEDGQGSVQGNFRNERQFMDAVSFLSTRLS